MNGHITRNTATAGKLIKSYYNGSWLIDKAAALFGNETMPDEWSNSRQLANELEKYMSSQLSTCWTATTLEQYVEKSMIPRGLRIKKNPTFQADESFNKKWNDTLSDCSLKLIKLLIEHEYEKLKTN